VLHEIGAAVDRVAATDLVPDPTYQVVHPPSTTRFAPVMCDDASEARNSSAPHRCRWCRRRPGRGKVRRILERCGPGT